MLNLNLSFNRTFMELKFDKQQATTRQSEF